MLERPRRGLGLGGEQCRGRRGARYHSGQLRPTRRNEKGSVSYSALPECLPLTAERQRRHSLEPTS
jgi:hypothetical protein